MTESNIAWDVRVGEGDDEDAGEFITKELVRGGCWMKSRDTLCPLQFLGLIPPNPPQLCPTTRYLLFQV